MKISKIGELLLLEQIRKKFSEKSGRVLVGIGDDAAAVRTVSETLLVTTDMMVEKVHFDLRFITPYQLGFKLLSVNVSDIYAMGGKPFSCLLNLAVNRNIAQEFLDMFFEGIRDACTLYRMTVIGGDLSASVRDMCLSATVLGHAKKCIRRSGARAGDRIYVTGGLGDSACGLELLKRANKHVPLSLKGNNIRDHRTSSMKVYRSGNGKGGGLRAALQDAKAAFLRLGCAWKDVQPLVTRHLLPEARNSEPIAGKATALIDVSDGLLIDLTRLCHESRTGARIYRDRIPLSRELRTVSACLGMSPEKLALSGGEDYELLFTVPKGTRVKAHYIGDIVQSGMVMVDREGREKPFLSEGYQHFRKKKTNA